MSDLAKTARAANRNKAQRLTANETDARSVDASSWTPCEPLKADEQTGPKPIGRQARKAGGRVEGCSTTPRADMKPRKGPKREHRDMGGMDSSVPTSRFDFAPSGPGKLASVMGMKKHGGAVEGRRKRDAGGALSYVSPAYALATDPKKLKAISPVANLFKRGGKAESVSDGELEGTRPTGGRMARKDGGKTSALSKAELQAARRDNDVGAFLRDPDMFYDSPKSTLEAQTTQRPKSGRSVLAAVNAGFTPADKRGVSVGNGDYEHTVPYFDPAWDDGSPPPGMKKGGRAKRKDGGVTRQDHYLGAYAREGMDTGQSLRALKGHSPVEGLSDKSFNDSVERNAQAADQAFRDKANRRDPSSPPVTKGNILAALDLKPADDSSYRKGGRAARKDGGRASKGKMNVNIIIDTGKDQNAGPAPGGPPMPHPPMPMPIPQPPVAGPPPAMGGGMPPMPAGPNPIPPGLAGAMPRKRGGRAMNAGAGSGEGRLEKTAQC